MTGLYTTAMVAGGALAAATSVPISHVSDSWRVGIGVWAAMAAVALVPMIALARKLALGRTTSTGSQAGPIVRASRSRLGWALAIFFGFQSFSAYALIGWLPQIYRDAGFSAQTGGLLLAGVIAAGAPMALVMPALAARRPDQRPLVLALAASMLVAYIGLAVAPHGGVLIWTALLAFGQGAFPLALALIGLRARTPAGTVALSAFSQSAGYMIAVAGPLAVGVLYELTGGWLASLGVLFVAAVIQVIAGIAAARPRTLEDEMGTKLIASGAGGSHGMGRRPTLVSSSPQV